MKQYFNFPENKKTLIANAAVAIFILLLIVFVYIPKHKAVSLLNQKIKQMDNQIKATQSAVGDLDILSVSLADVQKELTSYESRISDKRSISSVLSEFSKLAKASSIEVVSIKPDEPEALLNEHNKPVCLSDMPLKCMQVDLRLKASYGNIAVYIKSIQESASILAKIDKLNMSASEEDAPVLDIDLVLTVYMS